MLVEREAYSLVEPVNLGGDEIRRDEAFAGEELLDLGSLVSFALKDSVRVAGIVGNDVVDGCVGAAPGVGACRAQESRLDLGDVVQGGRGLVYRGSHGVRKGFPRDEVILECCDQNEQASESSRVCQHQRQRR